MTIKEVAEKFSLSEDTLRFYEKKGLIGPVKKTKGGIRDYEEKDLIRIEFVKCMRNAEIPIAVLKEYIDLFEEGDDTISARKELLNRQRMILKEKINQMQEAYEKLSYKVDLLNEGKLDEYLNSVKEK